MRDWRKEGCMRLGIFMHAFWEMIHRGNSGSLLHVLPLAEKVSSLWPCLWRGSIGGGRCVSQEKTMTWRTVEREKMASGVLFYKSLRLWHTLRAFIWHLFSTKIALEWDMNSKFFHACASARRWCWWCLSQLSLGQRHYPFLLWLFAGQFQCQLHLLEVFSRRPLPSALYGQVLGSWLSRSITLPSFLWRV